MNNFTVSGKLRSEVYSAVPSGKQKSSSESAVDQFDDLALERRRQERLKRKQLEKREDGVESELDDGETVVDDHKPGKRRKKKKQTPDLWSDAVPEEEIEPVLVEPRRKNRRKNDDDWLSSWDE